jgi:hypothetical protein
MKMYGGVEEYIHAFLTSTRGGCEWSASSHGRLIPGKEPLSYLLDRMLGGPQSWPEHYEEKKNFLTLLGIEP